MNRRIALGAATLLFLAGCGTANRTAPIQAAPKSKTLAARDWQAFFPTQPGSTWQYDAVAHPTDDPYVDYPGSQTIRVESSRQEAGQTVIELRDIDTFTTSYRFPTLVVSAAGVALKGVDYWGPVASPIEDLTVAFLRFPLTVGSRWDDGEWIGKVLKEEKVTVPAGTFDTWKLDVIGTHDQAYTAVGYYWIAKGVGVVKSDLAIEGWLLESSLSSFGK